MSELTEVEGSYLTPAFESATVADAMRPGVLTCPRDTPLRTVARMMASYHIHCVVVTGVEDGTGSAPPTWGIISDLDLIKVTDDLDDRTAGAICATELVNVDPSESLEHAAQIMAEHDITHLVVADPNSRQAVGVLSTLDVAGVIAWGRA
jgi:CBS domain-containing protein